MTVLHLVHAAGEPSKVPFYLVGGALAVCAVLLSFVGLSQPTFPGSERSARFVMLVSLLLVIGALAAAIGTDK
jgi:hypothetical protein